MNQPLISIIVPTHNRVVWLSQALVTLYSQRTEGQFTYEIVVVDNASSDETASVVRRLAERSPVPIHYFHQPTPGDAPTRNLGVQNARGEWLAFFDDDQFAPVDWLLQLRDAARQTGAAVLGGPVHLDLPEWQLARIGDVCREALREVRYYDRMQPYEGKHLPGCGNALVARRVFDEVGQFDATMINGGSDSDFFLRARAAGHELWYAPHASIRHRVPPERLTAEYLRWDALQGAENVACFDHQRRGAAALAVLAAARGAQAILVHLPMLLLAHLQRNPGRIVGRKTRLWRAEGYIRRALSLIAPRLFPQRHFLESLNFHKGFRQQGAET